MGAGWGGWNTQGDLLASAGRSGEPTCDVAAKKSKSVVGRLERGASQGPT